MKISLDALQPYLTTLDTVSSKILPYLILTLFSGGKNNVYQIYEKNELSSNSHENAVLEHYHAKNMLDILNDPSCNVLHMFDENLAKKYKQFMISAILCTDMSRHFKMIEEFKAKRNKLDPENAEDKAVRPFN